MEWVENRVDEMVLVEGGDIVFYFCLFLEI